ncbi:MAG: DUF4838 domain-containing protein [Victivallales bacterium]|nr:DUF4838 domain-containing protein [Victivallales bacterium]
MKHLLTVIAFLCMMIPCLAKQITFAEADKPRATIVTPQNAPEKIATAARNLQKYIVKICGVQLPIRTDGKRVAGTGLYIGHCEGSPECTLAKAGASWEGYVIEERDGNLYFTGLNPTPVAFGVYSFIEEDLGVRWYAPGDLWEKVPKAKKSGNLSVDVRPRTVVPGTSPRIWSSHNWSSEWNEWNVRNKTCKSEVISKRNFQNRIYQIFPVEKYAKEHPEYYPLMRNGKRYIPPKGDVYWRPCESNPEVQRIVVDYINDFFDKNPTQDSFSIGMDDVSHLCCCPNCRAMDDAPDSFEYQRFSDRHYKFVNIIAKEVAKTHPDKFIGTLIYAIALQPPKQVPVMEPNVFGYITETSAAWWMPGQKKIDHDLTSEWRRRIQHLSRYDYYGFASMTPRYYPHYVDEQMKYDKSLGLEGMYIEVYTFLPLTTPMIWLTAKLQWDASQDADKLLDDFMTIYGPAKQQMARFWALLEASYQVDRPGRGKWEHRKIINQALAISPEDLDKAFTLLDEAEQAASKDESAKARIAIHRDALKLASYAVRPYAIDQQIQQMEVNSQADADKVFELANKMEQCKAGRDEFIDELKKRDDMIGKNIRGLLSHKDYIPLGSFDTLETSFMTGLFQAIVWYMINKPNELKTLAQNFDNPTIKDLVDGYVRLKTSGQQPKNLIINGDFEIVDKEKVVAKDMLGWEADGCPRGWNSWSRGDKLVIRVVPEGHSGNAVKVTKGIEGGCLIQSVRAEEGGTYLLTCYTKVLGSGKASMGIRYRTKDGQWCKSRTGEISFAIAPKKAGEWIRTLLIVNVPKGIDAGMITVMPNIINKADGDAVLLDDFVMYKLK